MSHPTWVRGLKSVGKPCIRPVIPVAPYMGAWIEIGKRPYWNFFIAVAPYMGAWIEIWSLCCGCRCYIVAPYMGAWIEIKHGKQWLL